METVNLLYIYKEISESCIIIFRIYNKSKGFIEKLSSRILQF